LLTRHSNTVPCCQKYTITDCFFGDFVYWDAPIFRKFEISEKFGYSSKFLYIYSLFFIKKISHKLQSGAD